MNGDPVDPVSFHRAVRGLWDGLAGNAGIDLGAYLSASTDGEPDVRSGSECELKMLDEQLQSMRSEAHDRLMGLLFVEELRAWKSEGQSWHRLSPEAVRDIFLSPSDTPMSLYVDSVELAGVLTTRWPDESTSTEAAPLIRRRGRPPGSGSFAKYDDPLVEQMREMIKSGEAPSVHAAAVKLAPEARGAGDGSKVRRLCDRYFVRYPREAN